MAQSPYLEYLKTIKRPFKKLAKLDFLQPDNSVAFSLDNNPRGSGNKTYSGKAFIQSGNLSVSLNNGQRRKATITLANRDRAFDFAVNNIWFGQRIRLSMGVRLYDGTDFYLPQMVGYVSNPQLLYNPQQRTSSFPLVDKWAALDGTECGILPSSYKIDRNVNILSAIRDILHLSRYTLGTTSDIAAQLDNVLPVLTNYYDDKIYSAADSDGSISQNISMLLTPYTVTEAMGSNVGKLILQLNEMLAGIVGYNAAGEFTLEPSEDDISDLEKPVLWTFTPDEKTLLYVNETLKTDSVYNDVIITGEGVSGKEVWGRAQNFDPKSETNINLIGSKTLVESNANYWNAQQCVSLAAWKLKRKTVLQKSIVLSSSQMFHLEENRLIRVKRIDKEGQPYETHLINSFTLPIGETGAMSINCTSVNDIGTITTTSSGADQQND